MKAQWENDLERNSLAIDWRNAEVLERTIAETRSQMADEMAIVQIPARIHYNLGSFVTVGHEANTCLSAMVNEIRKTVVVRTTA